MKDPDPIASEQRAYAAILGIGMRVGLTALVVTFAIYVLAIRAPHVPIRDLPRLWGLPASEFLKRAGIAPGWGWVKELGYGDYLNLGGIVFLSCISAISCLRIVPILLAKRDYAYAVIVLLVAIVLALAASGLFAVGGH